MHTTGIILRWQSVMKAAFGTALLLICIAVAPLTAQSTDAPATPARGGGFDPSRDAAKDIADALQEAGRSGRRVMLDVGGEWCVWCHRLDTLIVRHDSLSSFLHRNYVVVKVNYSKENKNETVLAKYPKIPGYPHLFVLDSRGTLLRSQDTGELESGKGHDPGKVMAFLRAWAPPGGEQ